MNEGMDNSRQRLAEFLAARIRATRTEKKERQDRVRDAQRLARIRSDEKSRTSSE